MLNETIIIRGAETGFLDLWFLWLMLAFAALVFTSIIIARGLRRVMSQGARLWRALPRRTKQTRRAEPAAAPTARTTPETTVWATTPWWPDREPTRVPSGQPRRKRARVAQHRMAASPSAQRMSTAEQWQKITARATQTLTTTRGIALTQTNAGRQLDAADEGLAHVWRDLASVLPAHRMPRSIHLAA
ncbi:MAG: hypothetical protein AAFR04_10800 [Pseudomonadota bacterium]